MTERRAAVRWGIIAAGLVIAVVAISLLVYGLVQHGDEPTPGSAPEETSTSSSPEPTDGGAADDAEGSDDGADGEGAAGGSSGEDGDQGDASDLQPRADYVPEPLSGQEAIDALGDDIEEVADRNGKTVEEFKEFLRKNPSAVVQPDGFVVFEEPVAPGNG